MSAAGSTFPAGWMTFSSVWQRTTCRSASHSRMLARNLLPRPSPLDAPATRPAMSWNSIVSQTMLEAPTVAATCSIRGSLTGTVATLGSIVVNG